MHFTRPEIDTPLLSELYEYGLVAQADWTRWDEKAPDDGTLTQVLLEHAEAIATSEWALWLCQRHNFIRVPSLEPDPDFITSLSWTSEVEQISEFYGCYPVKVKDRAAYLAAMRPDVVPRLKPILEWLKADHVFLFAITPSELKTWTNLNHLTV